MGLISRLARRLNAIQIIVVSVCLLYFVLTTIGIIYLFVHSAPSAVAKFRNFDNPLIGMPSKRPKGPYKMPNHVPHDMPDKSSSIRDNPFSATKLNVGRDFHSHPLLIHSRINEEPPLSMYCPINCSFRTMPNGPVDGQIGEFFRTMENRDDQNDMDEMHRSGTRYISTTSLTSDVPTPYFSWHDFGFMDPVQNKTSEFDAIVMISNCQALNDRLAVVHKFKKNNIRVGTFGGCFSNAYSGDKVKVLARAKFTFAFENSNADDYVTEKFWQALVAGSVPVVYGSSLIADFAPAPNSFLHVRSIDDVERVAARMKELLADETKYQAMLAWKRTRPSDQFIALIDLNAVHSTCRVCLKVADWYAINTLERIRGEHSLCVQGNRRRFFVRERGRLEFLSMSASVSDLKSVLSFHALITAHFESLHHRPIWVGHRPDLLHSSVRLNLYRVYPSFVTVREALYGKSSIISDIHLKEAFSKPAPAFDVIFI